jgi:RHS repeat-associated protein
VANTSTSSVRAVHVSLAYEPPQTYFVYDGAGHLIGQYDGSGAAQQETVWLGDLPVATIQAGTAYYIAPDHIGAPHQITDASQNVVWFWDHDPFGSGAPTGTLTYALRFPGQFYDPLTGLYYNGFRDYDSATGRYIESDPIGLGGGINTYAYGRGNPLTRVDPFGFWSFTIQFYNGFGGGVTFGRDPLTGQTFDTFRVGVGFEGGFSFDPNGGRPGAESFCKNQGTGASATAGMFGEIGAGVGAFGLGASAGGSADFGVDSRTLKGYLDKGVFKSIGYDPTNTSFGFKLGGSAGFEIGSNNPAESQCGCK